ncbi:MAG: PQQ-dependent sugar dehydrogenase [Chloroflexota bacterium]
MKNFVQKFLWVAVLTSMLASATSIGKAEGIRIAPVPKNVKFETVVSGLNDPLLVTHAGDGSNRLFIVQRDGKILIHKNGGLNAAPFLDVGALLASDGGEQGLLGLAFDPSYETNGKFYIVYTALSYAVTLARYTVSANPDIANTSGEILLSIPKTRTNHNGGMITFGPDGYLYMSVGDGGGGGDPDNNAQDRSVLLGKILRLDVSGAGAYAIPTTNPYYNDPDPNVREEIWSYGLRNPWRFSFDRSTGDLFIGDVGQNAQEEVDFQAAGVAGGQNYGWRILEGNLCYSPAVCTPPANYVPPVTVYDHGTNDSNGCSVTGGYVYRGSNFPALTGVYLYADFCLGKIWGLTRNISDQWVTTLIADTDYMIPSFGEDEQGELYIMDFASGSVLRLAEATVLSQTLKSTASRDGHILELHELLNRGGVFSSTQTTFPLGDDQSDRQFRAILSFPTASLPDNAKLLSVTLKIRQHSVIGQSPFATHGGLLVEIGRPYFGTSINLEAADFQALGNGRAATFNPTPVNGWYSARFIASAFTKINLKSATQFRLAFTLDDNDDLDSDFVRFISGNSVNAAARPTLIIAYFIP